MFQPQSQEEVGREIGKKETEERGGRGERKERQEGKEREREREKEREKE